MSVRSEARGRRLDALLIAAALGTIGVSALAALWRFSWLLELFTHFRLQYLAVQIPLLALLAWRRRWALAAISVPFIVVNAIAVLPYWPRETAVAGTGPGLKLMTVNLYGRNDDHARFLELARRENPDVLLVLEVNDAWAQALETLEHEYPQHELVPREGFFGIAILSRLPILDWRSIDLLGAPALSARLGLASGRAVHIVGVHLRPPVSKALAAKRNAQLEQLGNLIEPDTEPLIVAGDFNMAPYSPVLAGWLERTGLSDTRRGRGFGMSWPAFLPILGIPIDHCLINRDLGVSEHYYSPAFGSDHYAVLTRLFLRDT
jgi:endonuclease/exonuclease/phosphatase (EEP) superfamily protein YafD